MKRGHIILIAGAALLVAGIAITAAWGMSFAGSFMADNTIIERTLEPGQSVEATRNVESPDRPLSLAIGIDPEQQSQPNGDFRLEQTVTDPGGRVVSTSEFRESFATTITPEAAGVYTVTITNLGTGPVTVGGAFGHIPFMGPDGQPNVDEIMSSEGLGALIAGGGLATAGVIVLIVGAIVTAIDGRQRPGTTASTTEGGITYRKD